MHCGFNQLGRLYLFFLIGQIFHMFLFIVLNLKLIPPVDKKLPRSKLKTFFKIT